MPLKGAKERINASVSINQDVDTRNLLLWGRVIPALPRSLASRRQEERTGRTRMGQEGGGAGEGAGVRPPINLGPFLPSFLPSVLPCAPFYRGTAFECEGPPMR